MTEKDKSRMPDDQSDLRRRAEEMLRKQHGELNKIAPAGLELMFHELQVHQIELEMQNDELRRTQQELEASREKYFDLYDLAPVGYFSINEKGIILEANLTAAALLGKERSDLVNRPFSRFIFMEDQDIYYLCHKQLVKTHSQQAGEMRMLRKDGAPFWARFDISIGWGTDDTTGTRVVIVDISKRKQIEEALTESEKRYHLLFENMSEGSAYCKMLYDDKGTPIDFVYVAVNPAFGLLTGLDNVVGKNVTEAIPGIKESHPELFEIYGRVALTGRPEKFEIEFRPLAAWLSISVYSTEKNYFVAVFDNITRRKRAEHRRALSAEILSILNDPPAMDAAIDCIVTAIRLAMGFDAVGIRLHRGNEFPYVAQEGFSKDFLLTENTLAVRTEDGGVCFDKDGNISLECTCGLVISGHTDPANQLFTPRGSFWTNESSILLDLPIAQDPRLHPRNRCIHEGFRSVALIPLRAGKQIMGILQLNDCRTNQFTPELIAFFEDLGVIIGIALARKQAEEQIKALNETLKHRVAELDVANKELETFSYSVSHDLRAPLRHMTGFVKLLRQRLKDHPDEKTHYYADTISEASQKMSLLIDALLNFSHLGRAQMRKEKVNLNTLVSEVVREIQEQLENREVRWEIDELPDVSCDRALLGLVLTNLISNAVKYTGSRTQAEIKIGYKADRDDTIVFVKDNGAGFDMKHVDRLFGVFQRLHSQAEFEGTGIGLANVRQIISRHGGRTWAEGSVDQGATFYFSLPRHREA